MKNHVSSTPSIVGVFVLVALMLGMYVAMSFQNRGASPEVKNEWKTNQKNIKTETNNHSGKNLMRVIRIQYSNSNR